MNIYIGNLSYRLNEDEIKEVFEQHGEVASVKIITDKFTKKSKGFGFVEMPNDEEGQKAIQEVNNVVIDGRPVKVNEARPRKDNDKKEHF